MKPSVNSSEDMQAKFHINMVGFSYFNCNTEISVSYGYTYLNASALISFYTRGKVADHILEILKSSSILISYGKGRAILHDR